MFLLKYKDGKPKLKQMTENSHKNVKEPIFKGKE